MSTICSTGCLMTSMRDTIEGASTSCSASCGSRTGVRTESSSMRILGTSITCSGTWISCGAKASTNGCCSISGTGASSIGARMICSTACRWTRSCGLTSVSRSGPDPPGGRHVIHVHRIVQGACRLERGMRPERGRVVHLEIPPLRPCHFLTS